MSTSGPLLPTKKQEEPGETPISSDSAPVALLQKELVSSSPVNSTQSSPFKILLTHKEDEKKTLTSPDIAPLSFQHNSEKRQELLRKENDLNSKESSHQILVEQSKKIGGNLLNHLSAGKEKSNPSRDYYNAAYSEMFQGKLSLFKVI